MRVNRNRLCILLLLLCGSCIEPYEPLIREEQSVLVINGMISDKAGPQQVVVSRSTPYNEPFFEPVPGCVVTVEDEQGQICSYTENAPGVYEVIPERDFLRAGKSYALYLVTPDGGAYRSDYDTMLACSPMGDLYIEEESRETSEPGTTIYGIQFFNDVTGTSGEAVNYRWILEETWAYQSPYVSDYIWFGGPVLVNMSDSTHTCYMTTRVQELFSASARYLSANRLERNKLHYVSNETPRLTIRYSVLVEQQALTNRSFDYWDRMGKQSNGGGLYETQPSSVSGNLYNVNDPQEKVLGCFYAAQVRQKRLTVSNDFDFSVPGYTCALDTVKSLGVLDDDYPYYLFSISPFGVGPPYLTGEKRCFDCRMYGGSTTPPDYWLE